MNESRTQQAACNVFNQQKMGLIGINMWHVAMASLSALWPRSAFEEDAEWEWVGNFIAFGKAQFSSDKNGKEICWLRASSNIFSVILWFRTILISETSSTSQFIFALHSTFNHKSYKFLYSVTQTKWNFTFDVHDDKIESTKNSILPGPEEKYLLFAFDNGKFLLEMLNFKQNINLYNEN